ncbi:hypothetical protein GCM10025867_19700 [Frondihabitans sucicola]|uniref:Glycoside hydrolase family 127 protein n=1 Tax=Frondihabitans sucicola TaxID=1268041 RepID=A0ABN6XXL6_9MICO|nr:hypothetical protein GCM10025867_19700 [Frondihabitans sucicola]
MTSETMSSLHPAGVDTGGPVAPFSDDLVRYPVPFGAVRLGDGLLGRLQESNAATSIREGDTHLADEHAWENFHNAAEHRRGVEYHGPVFEDGEVYKWLEAVAWEAGRSHDPELSTWLDRYTAFIAAAQAEDGYLNTYFEVSGERTERYEILEWDHEIFNMGAMIQSAVAQFRATGKTGLLDVARKAANHLDRTFGPNRRQGTCGHPVIEMALVELYRATGERRYLDLAKFFVEVRGHEILDKEFGHFGSTYLSDRVPVRETVTPEGHAVRAVYLAAGATDVAIETHDDELLRALAVQWDNMVGSKMYLTGGLGSRWDGEAFGDPYELPSDRAYAETCAAIASMQWSWRLYLATGDSKYVDLIERQLYNAVLPAISYEGDAYFYVNALQVREGAQVDDPGQRNPAHGRQHWFGCSCCPTNIMRTLASVHQYVASSNAHGIRIEQFTSAALDLETGVGLARLMMETRYPWSGEIAITVESGPADAWELGIRIPAWAEGATVTVDGVPSETPREPISPLSAHGRPARSSGSRCRSHRDSPAATPGSTTSAAPSPSSAARSYTRSSRSTRSPA